MVREGEETPLPGSSNQGFLSESPSNPLPQPWPAPWLARAPLVPDAGRGSEDFILPTLSRSLGQVPSVDLGAQGDHQGQRDGQWAPSQTPTQLSPQEPVPGGRGAGTRQRPQALVLDLGPRLDSNTHEQ